MYEVICMKFIFPKCLFSVVIMLRIRVFSPSFFVMRSLVSVLFACVLCFRFWGVFGALGSVVISGF